MTREQTDKELSIEYDWEQIWKPILEKEDGSIDKEQLKLELHDYSEMIHRMSILTDRLTRSKLSYPTYPVDTIIEIMEEELEDERQDQIKDDKIDGVCSLCEREF